MDWGGWIGEEDIEDAKVYQFNSTSSSSEWIMLTHSHMVGWLVEKENPSFSCNYPLLSMEPTRIEFT
jgi:hypothetical protein